MRILLGVIVLLGGLYVPSFPQDLIVTDTGDSLNCKIIRMKDNLVYFRLLQDNKMTNTMRKSDQIRSIRRGYFSSTSQTVSTPEKSQIHLRVLGGSSQRLAKISNEVNDEYRDYQKGLKAGYQLDINGIYYPSESLGFGFQYVGAWYSNSMNNVYISFPDGSAGYFTISDNISMQYYGPAVASRLYLNDDLYLHSELSLGYLGYKDDGKFIELIQITGRTVGLYAGVGLDYSVTDQLGITGQISLLQGLLTKIKMNSSLGSQVIELEKDEQENLSRFDVSIGLFLSF